MNLRNALVVSLILHAIVILIFNGAFGLEGGKPVAKPPQQAAKYPPLQVRIISKSPEHKSPIIDLDLPNADPHEGMMDFIKEVAPEILDEERNMCELPFETDEEETDGLPKL